MKETLQNLIVKNDCFNNKQFIEKTNIVYGKHLPDFNKYLNVTIYTSLILSLYQLYHLDKVHDINLNDLKKEYQNKFKTIDTIDGAIIKQIYKEHIIYITSYVDNFKLSSNETSILLNNYFNEIEFIKDLFSK